MLAWILVTLLDNVSRATGANGRHRGYCFDPMMRGSWKATQAMPRRIVVELEPDEFASFDRACGRIAPADLLRAVALRIAQESRA